MGLQARLRQNNDSRFNYPRRSLSESKTAGRNIRGSPKITTAQKSASSSDSRRKNLNRNYDPYQGFGSKEKQQEALANAIREQYGKTPEQFSYGLRANLEGRGILDYSTVDDSPPPDPNVFPSAGLNPSMEESIKQLMQRFYGDDIARHDKQLVDIGGSISDAWTKLEELDVRTKGLDVDLISKNIEALGQNQIELGKRPQEIMNKGDNQCAWWDIGCKTGKAVSDLAFPALIVGIGITALFVIKKLVR